MSTEVAPDAALRALYQLPLEQLWPRDRRRPLGAAQRRDSAARGSPHAPPTVSAGRQKAGPRPDGVASLEEAPPCARPAGRAGPQPARPAVGRRRAPAGAITASARGRDAVDPGGRQDAPGRWRTFRRPPGERRPGGKAVRCGGTEPAGFALTSPARRAGRPAKAGPGRAVDERVAGPGAARRRGADPPGRRAGQAVPTAGRRPAQKSTKAATSVASS